MTREPILVQEMGSPCTICEPFLGLSLYELQAFSQDSSCTSLEPFYGLESDCPYMSIELFPSQEIDSCHTFL